MVSDELREALKGAVQDAEFHPDYETFVEWCEKWLLPQVIALERCRELLGKHCFVNRDRKSGLSSPICVFCGGVEPNEYDSKHLTGHANDCEIAKALEATP